MVPGGYSVRVNVAKEKVIGEPMVGSDSREHNELKLFHWSFGR